MATAWVERRLSAILAADVVGYSHLVEQDEAGALAALKDLRCEVIEPLLAVHHGRIVKLMGDGAIAEFGSVVDAVACAVGVQEGAAERQADVQAGRRIVFRIGINLGDVVVEGEDLLGDGVNVAARLEQLCEPGGVLVSGTAYDQLQGKLDLILDFVGEQRVKNISRPVRTYRVRLKGSRPSLRLHARRFRRWVGAGAAALVLLVIGPIVWLRPWEPRPEPASVERMALPLPDKPSIAVLPFANLSGDPEQEYFVDGLTEDLITDLSKVTGLFVVARNSVFPFKGRAVNVREVAEKLGVRYVLEGSVRRAGDQVRVNAQLIDTTTGGHLWAERHDGSAKDMFAVQDKFVQIIVQALALNLSKDEREEIGRGQTKSIAAREAFQRGWELYLRFTPAENARAASELKSAIALDPSYGRAYAALALVYFRGCAWEWNESLGMSAARAAETADLYLREAKSRPSSLANVAAAHLNLYAGRHDEAFTEAARALALDPNDPEAHLVMAWAMITTGKPQAGLEFIEAAMRLNPNYPSHYALAQGMALFAKGDLDEAARICKADPGRPAGHRTGAPSRRDVRIPRAAAGGTRTGLDVEAGNAPIGVGLFSGCLSHSLQVVCGGSQNGGAVDRRPCRCRVAARGDGPESHNRPGTGHRVRAHMGGKNPRAIRGAGLGGRSSPDPRARGWKTCGALASHHRFEEDRPCGAGGRPCPCSHPG